MTTPPLLRKLDQRVRRLEAADRTDAHSLERALGLCAALSGMLEATIARIEAGSETSCSLEGAQQRLSRVEEIEGELNDSLEQLNGSPRTGGRLRAKNNVAGSAQAALSAGSHRSSSASTSSPSMLPPSASDNESPTALRSYPNSSLALRSLSPPPAEHATAKSGSSSSRTVSGSRSRSHSRSPRARARSGESELSTEKTDCASTLDTASSSTASRKLARSLLPTRDARVGRSPTDRSNDPPRSPTSSGSSSSAIHFSASSSASSSSHARRSSSKSRSAVRLGQSRKHPPSHGSSEPDLAHSIGHTIAPQTQAHIPNTAAAVSPPSSSRGRGGGATGGGEREHAPEVVSAAIESVVSSQKSFLGRIEHRLAVIQKGDLNSNDGITRAIGVCVALSGLLEGALSRCDELACTQAQVEAYIARVAELERDLQLRLDRKDSLGEEAADGPNNAGQWGVAHAAASAAPPILVTMLSKIDHRIACLRDVDLDDHAAVGRAARLCAAISDMLESTVTRIQERLGEVQSLEVQYTDYLESGALSASSSSASKKKKKRNRRSLPPGTSISLKRKPDKHKRNRSGGNQESVLASRSSGGDSSGSESLPSTVAHLAKHSSDLIQQHASASGSASSSVVPPPSANVVNSASRAHHNVIGNRRMTFLEKIERRFEMAERSDLSTREGVTRAMGVCVSISCLLESAMARVGTQQDPGCTREQLEERIDRVNKLETRLQAMLHQYGEAVSPPLSKQAKLVRRLSGRISHPVDLFSGDEERSELLDTFDRRIGMATVSVDYGDEQSIMNGISLCVVISGMLETTLLRIERGSETSCSVRAVRQRMARLDELEQEFSTALELLKQHKIRETFLGKIDQRFEFLERTSTKRLSGVSRAIGVCVAMTSLLESALLRVGTDSDPGCDREALQKRIAHAYSLEARFQDALEKHGATYTGLSSEVRRSPRLSREASEIKLGEDKETAEDSKSLPVLTHNIPQLLERLDKRIEVLRKHAADMESDEESLRRSIGMCAALSGMLESIASHVERSTDGQYTRQDVSERLRSIEALEHQFSDQLEEHKVEKPTSFLERIRSQLNVVENSCYRTRSGLSRAIGVCVAIEGLLEGAVPQVGTEYDPGASTENLEAELARTVRLESALQEKLEQLDGLSASFSNELREVKEVKDKDSLQALLLKVDEKIPLTELAPENQENQRAITRAIGLCAALAFILETVLNSAKRAPSNMSAIEQLQERLSELDRREVHYSDQLYMLKRLQSLESQRAQQALQAGGASESEFLRKVDMRLSTVSECDWSTRLGSARALGTCIAIAGTLEMAHSQWTPSLSYTREDIEQRIRRTHELESELEERIESLERRHKVRSKRTRHRRHAKRAAAVSSTEPPSEVPEVLKRFDMQILDIQSVTRSDIFDLRRCLTKCEAVSFLLDTTLERVAAGQESGLSREAVYERVDRVHRLEMRLRKDLQEMELKRRQKLLDEARAQRSSAPASSGSPAPSLRGSTAAGVGSSHTAAAAAAAGQGTHTAAAGGGQGTHTAATSRNQAAATQGSARHAECGAPATPLASQHQVLCDLDRRAHELSQEPRQTLAQLQRHITTCQALKYMLEAVRLKARRGLEEVSLDEVAVRVEYLEALERELEDDRMRLTYELEREPKRSSAPASASGGEGSAGAVRSALSTAADVVGGEGDAAAPCRSAPLSAHEMALARASNDSAAAAARELDGSGSSANAAVVLRTYDARLEALRDCELEDRRALRQTLAKLEVVRYMMDATLSQLETSERPGTNISDLQTRIDLAEGLQARYEHALERLQNRRGRSLKGRADKRSGKRSSSAPASPKVDKLHPIEVAAPPADNLFLRRYDQALALLRAAPPGDRVRTVQQCQLIQASLETTLERTRSGDGTVCTTRDVQVRLQEVRQLLRQLSAEDLTVLSSATADADADDAPGLAAGGSTTSKSASSAAVGASDPRSGAGGGRKAAASASPANANAKSVAEKRPPLLARLDQRLSEVRGTDRTDSQQLRKALTKCEAIGFLLDATHSKVQKGGDRSCSLEDVNDRILDLERLETELTDALSALEQPASQRRSQTRAEAVSPSSSSSRLPATGRDSGSTLEPMAAPLGLLEQVDQRIASLRQKLCLNDMAALDRCIARCEAVAYLLESSLANESARTLAGCTVQDLEYRLGEVELLEVSFAERLEQVRYMADSRGSKKSKRFLARHPFRKGTVTAFLGSNRPNSPPPDPDRRSAESLSSSAGSASSVSSSPPPGGASASAAAGSTTAASAGSSWPQQQGASHSDLRRRSVRARTSFTPASSGPLLMLDRRIVALLEAGCSEEDVQRLRDSVSQAEALLFLLEALLRNVRAGTELGAVEEDVQSRIAIVEQVELELVSVLGAVVDDQEESQQLAGANAQPTASVGAAAELSFSDEDDDEDTVLAEASDDDATTGQEEEQQQQRKALDDADGEQQAGRTAAGRPTAAAGKGKDKGKPRALARHLDDQILFIKSIDRQDLEQLNRALGECSVVQRTLDQMQASLKRGAACPLTPGELSTRLELVRNLEAQLVEVHDNLQRSHQQEVTRAVKAVVAEVPSPHRSVLQSIDDRILAIRSANRRDPAELADASTKCGTVLSLLSTLHRQQDALVKDPSTPAQARTAASALRHDCGERLQLVQQLQLQITETLQEIESKKLRFETVAAEFDQPFDELDAILGIRRKARRWLTTSDAPHTFLERMDRRFEIITRVSLHSAASVEWTVEFCRATVRILEATGSRMSVPGAPRICDPLDISARIYKATKISRELEIRLDSLRG